MRKASSLQIEFERSIKALESTRNKGELLFNNRNFNEVEILHLYSGLYMELITQFEITLEQLFIGLLCRKFKSGSTNVKPLVKFDSEELARRVIFNGKPYCDWLPYSDNTIKRANIYYDSGLPFDCLCTTDQDTVRQCYLIRNAIAHKSDHALKTFQNKVIGSSSVTPVEKTPAGFLRGVFRTSPIMRRYEQYSNDLQVIIRKICI